MLLMKVHVELGDDLANAIDSLVKRSGASGRPEVVRRLCSERLRQLRAGKAHKRVMNGAEDNLWHYYQYLVNPDADSWRP
jgi:metal-responsive CopG/Arc/MetJ family transcriptional regulator